MKREIKFRAWHKKRKTFLDFDLAVDKLGRTFSILDKCVYDEFTDEIELMQYTGLKDVNGKEIYEGDILRVTGEDGGSYVATVKWFGDEGYPAFDLDCVPTAWNYDANALSTIFNSGVETCEVIGNIYEKNDCEGK